MENTQNPLHPTIVGRIKKELEVLKQLINDEATYNVILAAKAESKGVTVSELQNAMASLETKTKAGVSDERSKLSSKIFNLVEKFLNVTTKTNNKDITDIIEKITGMVPIWKKTYAVKGVEKCPGFRIILDVTDSGISLTDVVRIPVARK